MNAFRLQAELIDGAVILLARVMGVLARQGRRPKAHHIVRAARADQSAS